MIAVWGSPNSGKTTFAVALASHFSQLKNNVSLVFCDNVVPTIPTVLPQSTTHISCVDNKKKSIGKVISAVEFSSTDILSQFISVPNNKFLCLLGYAFGENGTTYPEAMNYDVYSLYARLSEMTDIIIVDCTSMMSNALTSVALENADAVIRTSGCSYKDISFFASNLSLLPNGNVLRENHAIVLPNVRARDATLDMEDFYGRIDYQIKNSPDIEKMATFGELLLKTYPVQYRKEIKKIAEELILIG